MRSSPYQSSVSTSGPAPTVVRSTTNSEIENVYRYIDAKVNSFSSELNSIRSEMKSEIVSVMSEFRNAESKRHIDYTELKNSLDNVKRDLPTKSDITNSTRNWALSIGVFIIALATLLWAFFDTGTGITGSIAENVIESERRQQQIIDLLEKKTDKVSANDNNEPTKRVQ